MVNLNGGSGVFFFFASTADGSIKRAAIKEAAYFSFDIVFMAAIVSFSLTQSFLRFEEVCHLYEA